MISPCTSSIATKSSTLNRFCYASPHHHLPTGNYFLLHKRTHISNRILCSLLSLFYKFFVLISGIQRECWCLRNQKHWWLFPYPVHTNKNTNSCVRLKYDYEQHLLSSAKKRQGMCYFTSCDKNKRFLCVLSFKVVLSRVTQEERGMYRIHHIFYLYAIRFAIHIIYINLLRIKRDVVTAYIHYY